MNLSDESQALRQWRRDLHQIPELGHEEFETAAYIENVAKHLGFDTGRPTPTSVVVNVAGRASGPRVAWRADIDGLPIQEATDLPFASRHPGVMHACGHDGHMAIALGVLRRLAQERPDRGAVRVFFQPSEERHPGGARHLIEAGILLGVDTVLGLHLWSGYPTGEVGLRPDIVMANSDRFRITVRGRGGHGSAPHETHDAILMASQIVVNLQTIVSRRVSPLASAVVTCGAVHAGQAHNIIAEQAEILGTVRTLDAETQALVEREIRHWAETTAAQSGGSAVLEYHHGYPAVVNNPDVARRWAEAIGDSARVTTPDPNMGGEDFAYYLQETKGAFALVGAHPDGAQYPHHSPHFDIHEGSLDIGLEVAWRGIQAALLTT